jgi:hypothetical protein
VAVKNAVSQQQWDHKIHWFFPADADLLPEVRTSEDGRNMTETIFEYHDAGRSVGIARTLLGGFLSLLSDANKASA